MMFRKFLSLAALICLLISKPAVANNSLDSDAFMQMLLVQLQYQDPTAPMDQTDMVAQLSDLTMMEQNEELVYAMDALRNQVYQSQGLYASDLVGKQVMVIANIFTVEDGKHPKGEILLGSATDDLLMKVYNEKDDPEEDDPVAKLSLGKQEETGSVDFDLKDLKEPLDDATYVMYAYAKVEEQEVPQTIAQRSVVLSVVVPGGGQDVLVEVDGIGLVPLYAITEFEGEYTPEEPVTEPTPDPVDGSLYASRSNKSLSSNQDPLAMAAKAGLMKTRKRKGEVWTINPFFNQKTVKQTARRKPPTMRETMFRTIR